MNKILAVLVAIAATITVNAAPHHGGRGPSGGGMRPGGPSGGGMRMGGPSGGGMRPGGARPPSGMMHRSGPPVTSGPAARPAAPSRGPAVRPHGNPPSRDPVVRPHGNPPPRGPVARPPASSPRGPAPGMKPHGNPPPVSQAHKPHGMPHGRGPAVAHAPPPRGHHGGPHVHRHPRFGGPFVGGHGRHIPPPSRFGFHMGRPIGALFWERPVLPPILTGALYGWVWINDPWYFWLDGVYYYGEGYYFDGYNYCYNGGYYLCPPPTGQVINTLDAVVY